MPKLTRDEKWRRFNLKLNEQMKSNDFYGLGVTYQEMADFIDEDGGRFERNALQSLRNEAYASQGLYQRLETVSGVHSSRSKRYGEQLREM